jgi:hypothetical protein
MDGMSSLDVILPVAPFWYFRERTEVKKALSEEVKGRFAQIPFLRARAI